ncbi:MAG: hypothetical protein AAGI52_16445 [Bacteroidota bacterium]
MSSEIFHSVTFWMVAFVMLAAFVARAIHFFSVGRSLSNPFIESTRRDKMAARQLNAQARFRAGETGSFQDDLNDALRPPATLSEDDGPELYLPGMEKMPETWPPEDRPS